jgi:ribonuclease HI
VKHEHSTNNTTEYEALLLALRKMKALGQQNFIIKTDSKVIEEHIEKESEAKKSCFDKISLKGQGNGKSFQGLFSTTHSKRRQ